MQDLSVNKILNQKDISNLFIISDIHFGVRSDSIEWQNNMKEYFNDFFIPFIEENKDSETGIAILGDLFDNRNSINISTMNICSDIIQKMTALCPVTILTGNHDMFKRRDSSLSSLASVSHINGVTVISEPTIINYKGDKSGLWIPYMGDNKTETEYLRTSNCDYAFLHTECIGSVFDNNRPIIDGTNINLFKGTRVYSGHIHKRQESSDKHFIYVGSPYQLRRSDIGNKKGLYKLNIINGTTSFIPNMISPEYKRISIQKVLETSLIDFMEYVSNSYVDILVPKETSTDVNISDILNLLSPEKMTENGFRPYKNLISYIFNSEVETFNPTEKEEFSGSIEDHINHYLESLLESQNLDAEEKKKIIKLNEELISEAGSI